MADTNWREIRANFAGANQAMAGASQSMSQAGDIFSKMRAQIAADRQAKLDSDLKERQLAEQMRQFDASQGLAQSKFSEDTRKNAWDREVDIYKMGDAYVNNLNQSGSVMTSREEQIAKGAIPATTFDVKKSAGVAATHMPMIEETARKYNLDPSILASIAQTESAWNPKAVSKAGAQGMFQFMPATAQRFNIDPFDPVQAADGAARYLVELQNRYKGKGNDNFSDEELAIMAYNWGEGNVDSFLKTGKGAKGQDRPQESIDYVPKVLGYRNNNTATNTTTSNVANDATRTVTPEGSVDGIAPITLGTDLGTVTEAIPEIQKNLINERDTLLRQINSGTLSSDQAIAANNRAKALDAQILENEAVDAATKADQENPIVVQAKQEIASLREALNSGNLSPNDKSIATNRIERLETEALNALNQKNRQADIAKATETTYTPTPSSLPQSPKEWTETYRSIDGTTPEDPEPTSQFLAGVGASSVSQLTKSGKSALDDQIKAWQQRNKDRIKTQQKQQQIDWANIRTKQLGVESSAGINETTYNKLITEGKQIFGDEFDIKDTPAQGLHNAWLSDQKNLEENRNFYSNFWSKTGGFDLRVKPEDQPEINREVATIANELMRNAGFSAESKYTDVFRGIVATVLSDAAAQQEQIFGPSFSGNIETSGFGPGALLEASFPFMPDALRATRDRVKNINSKNLSKTAFGDDKAGQMLQVMWNKLSQLDLIKSEALSSFSKNEIAYERQRSSAEQKRKAANKADQSIWKQGQLEGINRLTSNDPQYARGFRAGS